MVRDREMNGLVRDEVAEYEARRENESPVERQVSPSRAVAPFGALVHQVDPLGALAKARGDDASEERASGNYWELLENQEPPAGVEPATY